MIEQKLICVADDTGASRTVLNDCLNKGWRITQISGAASQMPPVMCWVLLEREKQALND